MHNPIIVCKVLEHFGNCLYDEKYTDYKVQANYKDDSWNKLSHIFYNHQLWFIFITYFLLQNLDFSFSIFAIFKLNL